jgi:cytochrome c oxidase subunit II
MERSVTIGNRRARLSRLGAALAGLTILFTGCAEDAPQDFLNKPAGEVAEKADRLWDLTFLIAVVVFVIVEGLLVFALIRFRHRPGREAKQFHGNTRLEIVLTAVPALILAGIAFPTISTINDLSERPKDALEISVTAHQFWWEYRYEDQGFVTANELHIPVDQDVYLTLDGATTDPVTQENEVIHSFWVPRLAGKQDVIPGRINTLRLHANEADTYYGQCTEFCGLGHAYMKIVVVAQDQDEFDQWVEDQQAKAAKPKSGLAAEGAELFATGQFAEGLNCASCHAVESKLTDGEAPAPATGPNLTHFASRGTFASALKDNNAENLSDWLADPADMKPGARMPDLGLSQEEIDALVAYLQTLE